MAILIPLPRVFRQTLPMNCWFYAAKTIVYAKTHGRTLLLETDYSGTGPLPFAVTTGRGAGAPSWMLAGLPGPSFPDFASLFHFAQPATRPATWSAQELEDALRHCGPLWLGGASGSAHHIVAINGSDATTVNYGDPATGGNHTCTLEEFNAWKQQRPGLWNPMFYAG